MIIHLGKYFIKRFGKLDRMFRLRGQKPSEFWEVDENSLPVRGVSQVLQCPYRKIQISESPWETNLQYQGTFRYILLCYE